MIKAGQKSIQVYREDYKPMEVYKNTASLAGSTSVAVTGTAQTITGTYNAPADAVGIYGGFRCVPGKNLCPPPEPYTDAHTTILPNPNGTFSVAVRDISTCFHTLRTVTLPAGVYTVTTNLRPFILINWDGTVFREVEASTSFCVTVGQTVQVALDYQKPSQLDGDLVMSNAYIQIERGNTATAFERYYATGDMVNFYCPQRLVAAKGAVCAQSKNMLDMSLLAQNNNTFFSHTDNTVEAIGALGTNVYNFSCGQIMFPLCNTESMRAAGLIVTKQTSYALSCDAQLLEQGAYSNEIHIIAYGVYEGSNNPIVIDSLVIPLSSKLSRKTFQFSTGNYSGVIAICFRVNNNHILLRNIMLEKNDGVTLPVYQSYGKAVVTYPELRALEVPAADGGNLIKTASNGTIRHYLADVVQGTTCTRRVGVWQLTRDNLSELELATTVNTTAWFTLPPPAQFVRTYLSSTVCTHLKNLQGVINSPGFCMLNGMIYIGVDYALAHTTNMFSAWIHNQAALQTPVTFYYGLQTPTTETLDITPLTTYPLYTRLTVTPETGKLSYHMDGNVKVVRTI